MAPRPMPPIASPRIASRSLVGAAVGGVLAGAVDLAYALGLSMINGRDPLRVLQGIASGLLGAQAFEGGAHVAVIGVICHFAITLGAAIVFVLAHTRIAFVREQVVIATLLFGAGVYAFMHLVVLPLSAIPFRMSYSPVILLQGLAVHVLLVALPIVACVRNFSRASDA